MIAALDMTITTIMVAMFAAMPPTIAALAALLQSKRNSIKVDESLKEATQANSKTDNLMVKTEEIHTLTNSNLSKVSAELAIANTQISGLQALVSSLAARNGRVDNHKPEEVTKVEVTNPDTNPAHVTLPPDVIKNLKEAAK